MRLEHGVEQLLVFLRGLVLCSHSHRPAARTAAMSLCSFKLEQAAVKRPCVHQSWHRWSCHRRKEPVRHLKNP